MSTPHPFPPPRPTVRPHQAIHRPIVGGCGEDDHIQAVDKEVEVENALDKSVPLVLQESVQRLHQKHVMAILREQKEARVTSPPGIALHQPMARSHPCHPLLRPPSS